MSFDEGHVNQAEFPEAAAAVQEAREEYSAGMYEVPPIYFPVGRDLLVCTPRRCVRTC